MKKTQRDPRKGPFSEKRIKHLGIHLVAEFWLAKDIEEKEKLKNILKGAAKAANCTLLEFVVHKFSPRGITGVILLAESHIAIHTWPEKNYLAVDIFTCGDRAKPYIALDFLKKTLKPKKFEVREIKRGRIIQ